MYVSREALCRRAAELERFARQRGIEFADLPRLDKPAARIGLLATRLGIDLHRAFDLDRGFAEPERRPRA